jgi:hypothetical protein
MLIVETLEHLAREHDLFCHPNKSADNLDGPDEIYLFSRPAPPTDQTQYRYAFARWWVADGPLDLWVMLNPALGDTEKRQRPTLDRCIKRSKALGASGVIIANLFAARHNKPEGLRTTSDPVGPHNNAVLGVLSALAEHTFVAWGADGNMHGRAAAVVPLLRHPLCLGVTANGQPRHPLYVRKSVDAESWPVRERAEAQ